MKLVDAHIHLADPEYADKIDALIADANAAEVSAMVANSMNLETSLKTLSLSEKYPNKVYAAFGIHPWNVRTLTEKELEEVVRLIESRHHEKAVVAIGEVGLDSKYEEVWEKQLEVFDKMLRLAERYDLPVIVHSRGTTSFIVEMLPSYNVKRVLLHWFSHPMNALSKAMEQGYFITEGPPVVYSNGIRQVVAKVSMGNFLTETDGPVVYRKTPFNGQMTKPSFVRMVVEAVAQIRHMSPIEVSEQIRHNFEEFFRVKVDGK
jgi:TatD DNase family protein